MDSGQWCDIGGPNRTLEFVAQFYNHVQLQGRQVTMNNRAFASLISLAGCLI
jgi:alpha-L-fucosidase